MSFSMVILMVALAAVMPGFLICCELLRRRISNYRAAIGYDVTADQQFNYDNAHGRSYVLELGDGHFLWPRVEGDWQSAFIELNVQSRFLGRIVDPFVDIQCRDRSVRQYFERGAAGKRFVNVTEILRNSPAAGDFLRLAGNHLRFDAAGRLHVLRGAALPEGPILVLAPHPDDAEIAAFGLFSQRPAWVVTVTLGDNGPSLYGDFFENTAAASAEKARMRVWDSLTIPQIGGVKATHIANLGYFDGTLAQMRRAPDVPVAGLQTGEMEISRFRVNPLDGEAGLRRATWRNLVLDMSTLLAHIRPVAIVLPHMTLDPHPDHQHTTLALLEALGASGLKQGLLLFYANHLRNTEVYPFGANDGVISIPPMHDTAMGPACFQSVLCVPLSMQERLRKQIALETHHDLRPPPRLRQPTLARVMIGTLKTLYRSVVDVDTDYVRRAARGNEVFLVAHYGESEQILSKYQCQETNGQR